MRILYWIKDKMIVAIIIIILLSFIFWGKEKNKGWIKMRYTYEKDWRLSMDWNVYRLSNNQYFFDVWHSLYNCSPIWDDKKGKYYYRVNLSWLEYQEWYIRNWKCIDVSDMKDEFLSMNRYKIFSHWYSSWYYI